MSYVEPLRSVISGGWIRGDAQDYDEWAREVGDDRWSYSGRLPYFRRSEHHFDPGVDPEQHGFKGPIYIFFVTISGRKYPLRGDNSSSLETSETKGSQGC